MRSTYSVFTLLGTLTLAGAACGGVPDAETAEASDETAMMSSDAQASCYLARGTMEEAAQRPSPLGQTSITVGGQEALLCYGRPSANGRTVMGSLVPFGQPWRLGANEATALHLPFAAEVAGVAVEPGTYSIYAVPGETEWEFVLNRNSDRWGIPIDAGVMAENVGSFTRPAETTDSMVEQLTMAWESHGENMGHVVMTWENTKVEIPIHHGSM